MKTTPVHNKAIMSFLTPTDPQFNPYWKNYMHELRAGSETQLGRFFPSTLSENSDPLTSSLSTPVESLSIKHHLGIALAEADQALEKTTTHANYLFQISVLSTQLHPPTFKTMYNLTLNMQKAQEIHYTQVLRRVKLIGLIIFEAFLYLAVRHFAPAKANGLSQPLIFFTTALATITWVYHSYQDKNICEIYSHVLKESQALLNESPRLFSLHEPAIVHPAI
ncbi:MAG: hypothetical protein QRY72_00775 [Candidatus Rhabdochlamydia sp.]